MESKKISSSLWRLNQTLEAVNEELMDNGGELTPEIEEALTSAEMTQVDIVDGLHEIIRLNKSQDTVISDEIKRLQALKKSRSNAVDGLKRFLLNYMLGNGIQKIEGQYCKATVAGGKESVECDAERMLAQCQDTVDEFVEKLPSWVKVEVSINKTALMDLLKQKGAVVPTVKEGKVDVPLAAIVRNPYLLIK